MDQERKGEESERALYRACKYKPRLKAPKMGANQLMLFKAEEDRVFVKKHVRARKPRIPESDPADFYKHLNSVSFRTKGIQLAIYPGAREVVK